MPIMRVFQIKKALRKAPYFIFSGAEGEIRYINNRCEVERDSDGRVTQLIGTAQDITERKKMEAALRESENRFRTSFEASAVGMVICDDRGYFLEVNKAFCRNLDYEKSDFANKSFLDITHPQDIEESKQRYRQCMLDRKPFSMEKRYITKQGKIWWGMTSVTPIFNADGSFLNAIAHCQDITGRKQAQEALIQSERLLSESQKIADSGSYSLDIASKTVTWSDQAYRIFGYEPGEVQPDFDLVRSHIHPEDLQRFLSANHACFTGRKDYDETYRLIKKDGSVRVVHSRAYLKVDESGAPWRTLGALQDITEQVTAQEALKLSKQKFQSMMNHINVGMMLIGSDMKVLEVNRQMKKWFPDVSWEEEPICYRIFNDPPRDTVCDDCPVRRTFEDGSPHESTTTPPTKDGFRNYRIISSPINGPQGKVSTVINTVEDITERLKYESRLRQAQKLESIGTLAGGIAHDFNNILSAIIGYTELALDDSDPGSMVEESLHEIYRAGKRARDLVRQILTFARKSGEEIKPVHVRSIVTEVLKLIRSTIPANINIEHNLTSDSFIMGNAAQVHQILMNLCTNAAHAMETDGGRLSVAVFDHRIDETDRPSEVELASGNYLVIRVADNGVGIAPDHIGSIFEPYFSTKGPGEGSGLGLAVVHGIVESYKGKISVKSTPGEGSVFQVYLPISKKCRARPAKVAERLPSGTERVLLIDDEVPIVKLSRQILERLGYRVTAMSDSMAALKLFCESSSDFDLVITDMTMPGMTGDRLAAAMMEINPDIPIILHTGYSKRISEASVRRMGIKALVYKPLVKAEFAATVRNVLDAVRTADPSPMARERNREVEESL